MRERVDAARPLLHERRMLLAIDARLRYALHAPADLLLAVEVAQAPDQRLVEDRLVLSGTGPLVPVAGEDGVGRRTWTRGMGIVGAYGMGVHPPDSHAVVEVWLARGWRLIDPTRLAAVEGIVRICVGRDTTDVGFLTMFGTGDLVDQQVSVARIG